MHFATKKRNEANQNELTLSQIRKNCAKLPVNMCKLQKHTCHPDLFDALDLFAPRPDQKATKTKATHLRVWPQAQAEPFIVFSSFARSQMAPRKRARLSEDSEEILEFEDIFAASDAPVEQQIVEWESWRQKVGVRKPSNEKIEKNMHGHGLRNPNKENGIITLTQQLINVNHG